MTRILVATPQDTLDALMKTTERERLESLGHVVWRPDLNRQTAEEEYGRALAETRPDILVIGWASPRLTARLLQDNPQLELAINLTGEVKNYVVRECLEQGLTVTNWGDVPAASVAESALMMTLASLRKVYHWQCEMHQNKAWRPDTPNPRWTPQGLFDKTVGLYGFGRIAREYTLMLKPFNPRILVFSGWIAPEDKTRYGVETVDSLKALFAQSDIVAIHTGNRPDTHHSVNADILAAMKDGGHLIKPARGPIIDTDALVAELKRDRLYAALDVFEDEPLPADHPLRGLAGCLLFPHQGGPTIDYRFRCGVNAVEQVERHVSGTPLKYRIALDQYDRMT